MKFSSWICILILLTFCSNAVFATEPSHPVAKELRSTFLNSKIPATWELKFGTEWSCRVFSSASTESSAYPPYEILFTFSKVGGLVQNINLAIDVNNHPVYYVFDGNNLIGRAPSSNNSAMHYAVRVDRDNNLIGEISWNYDGDTTVVSTLWPRAIYRADYFAMDYFTCTHK